MRAPRRGFSLVEVIVALTILATSLAGFATLTFVYLKRARTFDGRIAQLAIMSEQTQRLTVLPFDSLALRANCATFAGGTLAHTRCITVATVNASRVQVKLVITPTNPSLKPDTVWFHRVKPAANPFCTTC